MNEDYYKVIDAPGLYRDPHSKAIVVGDSSALIEHRKKKQMMLAVLNKNKELQTEVKSLNDRMTNIENLLNILIQQKEK